MKTAEQASVKESDKPFDGSSEKVVVQGAAIEPYGGEIVRSRWLRYLYWLLWFVTTPAVLACAAVVLLTPPPGVERNGALGWVENVAREQPVPVVIVFFTLFGIGLWALRHRLPFAHHAHPPLRADLPSDLRGPFERARALLEEADAILERHDKDVRRDLSAAEREKLNTDLVALRNEMHRTPLEHEAFLDALVKADGEIDIRLGRWRKSEVREYAEAILMAVAVAFGLRTFVIEAFKIPSGSMIPTLQVGDHIFVNKFSYGPAIPFTHARVWSSMPPKRGDVMVFAYPEHPEQDFIKRVIAVPGDKLEARMGHPIINGWEVPSCRVGTYSYTEFDQSVQHEGELFVEYLGTESYLTFYDERTNASDKHEGPFVVEPGMAYVMGDNRNNSHDSRKWGGVPYDNIRGRAMFVWLSVSEGKFDLSRLGAPVMGHPRLPAAMKALEPQLGACLRDRPPIEKTTPP